MSSADIIVAVSDMAANKNHVQVVNVEHFHKFHKIFFDPCQSCRRIVVSGVCILAPSDNLFLESTKKLNLSRDTLETEASSNCLPVTAVDVSCRNEDAGGTSETIQQPDIVKSAEDSELVPSPRSPDIVSEMEGVYLQKQFSEPCNPIHNASRNLQRTVSFGEPAPAFSALPPVKVGRQISDSVALRRLSSAYGSQDQSLSPSNREKDEDDESTVLPPLLCLSNHNLTLDHSTEERSYHSDNTDLPTLVTECRLTDENEFESICMTSADERFVTATDFSLQEQIPPANQPIAYEELCAVFADLENQLIAQLLIGLLQDNQSPEFVYSIAEALFLPVVVPAAVGSCTLF